jgi:hypothetical protein
MILRFVKYTGAVIFLLGLTGTAGLFAQFSPGELSEAHKNLEGSTNCTKCHEVGKEISGAKCLDCHLPIRLSIDQKHGFHARTSVQRCTECHKEHLGRTAKTFMFDETSFDHGRTGFTLDGKHAGTPCARCHEPGHIRDNSVVASVKEHPRKTFLGLSATCVSCHATPHPAKFSTDCSSCHSTAGWQKVTHFDHSTTRFALEGRHQQIACEKCHTEPLPAGSVNGIHGTKPFSDCTPCHTSPHPQSFSGLECRSCHSSVGWNLAMKQTFNHQLTGYSLKGKHRDIRCDQCHKGDESATFQRRFKIAHRACTDCHSDKHKGQFLKTYANDCARCHTESTYAPSTFSISNHEPTRFPLSGSHMAVPCRACHKRTDTKELVFHFAALECASCHRDVHEGKMKSPTGEGCRSCHSTDAWKPARFDHSTTKFPLSGKHLSLTCDKCHREYPRIGQLSTSCESCHTDQHGGQFAAGQGTECASCHTPTGWHTLIFDHQTQSTFPLTGRHLGIGCAGCHKTETAGTRTLVRYKPVAHECTSCHTRRKAD